MIIETGISAFAQPAKLLVPLTAFVHSLRIISLSMQIFFNDGHLQAASHHISMSMMSRFMGLLQRLDASLLDMAQIAVVVFTVWFLIAWKENLVDLFVRLEKKKRDLGMSTGGLERVLLPMSSLLGWGLVTIGALMVLHVFGLNIQPLLTIGGVGGVAIGFGAQSVTSNAISGINLFLTRPFVVGDRVELKTTGGGTVLTGFVERIDVMRTIVRTDKGVPVAVPNRSITEMIVSNESRLGRSNVAANFKDPRQFTTSIGVRYEDLPKVKAITADIKAFLDQHPGVDKKLPYGSGLGSLQDWSVQIGLMAHTTPSQSSNFSGFSSDVMWKLVEIVEKHGAEFAYPTQVNIHQNPQMSGAPAAG
ncbi:hypothetical protein COCSUDRAFT_57655 [Coccomyxa subellipsoidea C-169]|uniref:Uncharacterized protein n=1 Tax=Coccomyxa subellipsoidea (strain C-169) TaxID=574566 RepID=I0YQ39_COCSC|nr:hypothetical protein COCSUDRAFT_57655 [Coccomyxa subellipsoidea C-169]EIE20508.1 hypothetical protein COCSUDRAFT_57655 [Coccomyxa subellipsoidea C-169]|eukprot:XP_005645052.1 hypothetical protein COCSUDRAFT_57655 [Coccomyxa subellipsoidea C-169]